MSKEELSAYEDSSSTVRYRRRGIYTVAYESPPRRSLALGYDLERVMDSLYADAPFAARLVCALFVMAPGALLLHIVGNLCMALAPSLCLYLASVIIIAVEDCVTNGAVVDSELHILVICWAALAVMCGVMDRVLDETKYELRGNLRAHFLPQLAKASLRQDIFSLKDPKVGAALPNPENFEETAPGWNFIEKVSEKIRRSIAIPLQFIVLLRVLATRPSPEREVMTVLCALVIVVLVFAPSNGAEGAPYMFWTENAHFKRLKALYTMIFSTTHRQSLVRDGTSTRALEEYERTSRDLGVVKDSSFHLAHYFKPPWYWGVLEEFALELPLALYALALPMTRPPSPLGSMAILQAATTTLRRSITYSCTGEESFAEVFSEAKWLYHTLERHNKMVPGVLPYPSPKSGAGMKVSFRNVSFKHPRQTDAALDNVSFDIHPGLLVAVVGESGKSSLMDLIARVFDPTSGQVLIHDTPLTSFNIDELRSYMAVLSEDVALYPLSAGENIRFGLCSDNHVGQDKVEDAARIGGAYDFIKRFPQGFGTHPFEVQTGWYGVTSGTVSQSILDKRNQHTGGDTAISAVEQQRLAFSRIFLRLDNSDIRLVIVDQSKSALDPEEESSLLASFQARRDGRTMIFITHHLGLVAKRADVILCLKDGKIVELGTYDNLVQSVGKYATLH